MRTLQMATPRSWQLKPKKLFGTKKVSHTMDRTFEARGYWMAGGKEMSAIGDCFPVMRNAKRLVLN